MREEGELAPCALSQLFQAANLNLTRASKFTIARQTSQLSSLPALCELSEFTKLRSSLPALCELSVPFTLPWRWRTASRATSAATCGKG